MDYGLIDRVLSSRKELPLRFRRLIRPPDSAFSQPRPTASAPAMPIGTPSVPYRLPGSQMERWVDIYTRLGVERILFLGR